MEAAGRPGFVLLHHSAVAPWVRERAAAAGPGPAAAGLPALRLVECKGKPPQLAADFDCAAGRFVSESPPPDADAAAAPASAPAPSLSLPVSTAPPPPPPPPPPSQQRRRAADADTRVAGRVSDSDPGHLKARGPDSDGRRGTRTVGSWNEAWGPGPAGDGGADPVEPGPAPSAGPALVCRRSLRRLDPAGAGRAREAAGGPAESA